MLETYKFLIFLITIELLSINLWQNKMIRVSFSTRLLNGTVINCHVKVYLQLEKTFLRPLSTLHNYTPNYLWVKNKAELQLLTFFDHVLGKLQQQRISECPLLPRLWDSMETGLKTHQDDSWKPHRKHKAFTISAHCQTHQRSTFTDSSVQNDGHPNVAVFWISILKLDYVQPCF